MADAGFTLEESQARSAADMEQLERLFRRAVAVDGGEMPPAELAARVLAVVEQLVHDVAQRVPQRATVACETTPGLESMGWMLWHVVELLAREDARHHDVLVAFINAFFALLRPRPWKLWGYGMGESSFLLGPSFRESFQGPNPYTEPLDAEARERADLSWINYCRFVARMTRDADRGEFSVYLIWFARDALEDCDWCRIDYPDAAVRAWEEVVDVCGERMFCSDAEFGNAGAGGDGARRWEGKKGFCRERWVFWEGGLRAIARDEARPPGARHSAHRTALRMESIRREIEGS